MSGNAPVIIKRKKVIQGGGHHGGAWKVAYADFVTAMMAFFMLMWLLNATTEQQRKGIADYFSPTIPINRISGGGDGMFGGDDIFSQAMQARSGNGGIEAEAEGDAASKAAEVAGLQNIEEVLLGQGGESALAQQALRHIVTRVTDEGLIIEVDLPPEAPSFITRVCGFGFHILHRQFGQARRAQSPQVAQAPGALQWAFCSRETSAV